MKAIARTIRLTPKKANLIATMIRGRSIESAMEILKYTPKKGAKILYKIVASAVSNAKNNFKQDEETLFVKEVIIGKGPTLKRGVPVSRGRVYPILKRTAHITVLVGINEKKLAKTGTPAKEESTTSSEAKVKTEKKATTQATTEA